MNEPGEYYNLQWVWTFLLNLFSILIGCETCNLWLFLIFQFQCCGIDGPDDWKPVFQTPTELPKSCCGKIPEGKVECLNEEDNKDLYKAGCKKKVFDLINSQPIILGSLLVSLILIQVIFFFYLEIMCSS